MTEQQRSLLEMLDGDAAIILALESHRHATEKLHQLGIRVGVEIQVLRRAPLSGPMLVKVTGREIAIGRELCSKIVVGV